MHEAQRSLTGRIHQVVPELIRSPHELLRLAGHVVRSFPAFPSHESPYLSAAGQQVAARLAVRALMAKSPLAMHSAGSMQGHEAASSVMQSPEMHASSAYAVSTSAAGAGHAFTNPAHNGGMTLGWFSSAEQRRRVRRCHPGLLRQHPAAQARAAFAMPRSLIIPLQRQEPHRWMSFTTPGIAPSRSWTPAAPPNNIVPSNSSPASMSATNPSYTLPSAMQAYQPGPNTCTLPTTTTAPFESHQSSPLWGDPSRLQPRAPSLQEQQSVVSDLHGHISAIQIC